MTWYVKIDITICGGFITYDEEIDKPFIEEFLISISGFLFQGILYLILSILMRNGIITDKLYFLFEEDGNEFVIECKDLSDAMQQRENYLREISDKTKIFSQTALKEYMENKGLKLIKINEER